MAIGITCTQGVPKDRVQDPPCEHRINRGTRMLVNAQIQFTKKQMEQLEDLRRQTGATRTELVRRAVDYCIRGIREHGSPKALLPLPTNVT